jgi:tRNA U34 5-carboxymethylaminomethyl modifying GTPase MnmE/TrmE
MTALTNFKRQLRNCSVFPVTASARLPLQMSDRKKCIDSALASVDEAISAIESCLNLDAVNIILDEAEQHLLELTGEKITDAVVDEVFSRFCVGK